MLHKWVGKNPDSATGNVLERALKNIDREDIIHKCIYSVQRVTDDSEKQAARQQLGQLMFWWQHDEDDDVDIITMM